MNETHVVTVRGLRRQTQGRVVADDIDFDALPGETVGVIDANGAGKTTTGECLPGCVDRMPARSGSSASTPCVTLTSSVRNWALGGTFAAGPHGRFWQVRADFPLQRTAAADGGTQPPVPTDTRAGVAR